MSVTLRLVPPPLRLIDAPAPSWSHIARLSDDTGLFEHARHATVRREHGYCVDDVARGLLIASREPQPTALVTGLAERYLAFLTHAMAPDGTVRNRLSYDRRWQDEPTTGDWWGRAMWGLGTAAGRSAVPWIRREAREAFLIGARQRSPWSRAMAFAALGAAEILRAPDPAPNHQPTSHQPTSTRPAGPQPPGVRGSGPQPAGVPNSGPPPASVRSSGPQPAGVRGSGPQPPGVRSSGPQPAAARGSGSRPAAALHADEVHCAAARDAARQLLGDAATVIGLPGSDPAWVWPERELTYANPALAEVMIHAGDLLGDEPLLTDGLRMLAWLCDLQEHHGHLSPVPVGGWRPGNSPADRRFDQQPIEAAATADACATAAAVTGDDAWDAPLFQSIAWFLGDNDTGSVMYDPLTGGCYDGLTPEGPNLNEGAESTLALVSTLQHARTWAGRSATRPSGGLA